jgi:hypothetical protein
MSVKYWKDWSYDLTGTGMAFAKGERQVAARTGSGWRWEDAMKCDACGRQIEDFPMVIGGMVLCPEVCEVTITPDLGAQVERLATEAAEAPVPIKRVRR